MKILRKFIAVRALAGFLIITVVCVVGSQILFAVGADMYGILMVIGGVFALAAAAENLVILVFR
jgi:hypothetical protein